MYCTCSTTAIYFGVGREIKDKVRAAYDTTFMPEINKCDPRGVTTLHVAIYGHEDNMYTSKIRHKLYVYVFIASSIKEV